MQRLFAAAGLVALLLLVGEAQAKKPIIMVCYRDHAPVGAVAFNGRIVQLTSVGPLREWTPGETLEVTVTVVQPSSGAEGIGYHVRAAPNAGVSRATLVRALPGSPAFQPGPVLATGRAVRRYRGKIVGAWEWTSTVTLVQK